MSIAIYTQLLGSPFHHLFIPRCVKTPNSLCLCPDISYRNFGICYWESGIGIDKIPTLARQELDVKIGIWFILVPESEFQILAQVLPLPIPRIETYNNSWGFKSILHKALWNQSPNVASAPLGCYISNLFLTLSYVLSFIYIYLVAIWRFAHHRLKFRIWDLFAIHESSCNFWILFGYGDFLPPVSFNICLQFVNLVLILFNIQTCLFLFLIEFSPAEFELFHVHL